MLVIVEGIDRVGKSTLVNKIQEENGFITYHDDSGFCLDKMDNENETDKMLKMLQMYSYRKPGIIFDRFHWTDFVYGCLQRNYPFAKALENKDKIEEMLDALDAIIVLVKPTDIQESSKQHGRDLTRHERLFEFLFAESRLTKRDCTYETIDFTQKWVLGRVNNYLLKG